MPAVGTVAFVSSVQVSNDSPGLVSRILFDSGDMAKTGQPLVELDASVERARLASMQAQKRLARVTVARSRALVARDALGPAQLDTDVAELERTTAEAAALEAEIERKLVRAGSQVMRTSALATPGTRRILPLASSAMAGPMPQPGAVSVILTSTRALPLDSFVNCMS